MNNYLQLCTRQTLEQREEKELAPYACHSGQSLGRVHQEEEHAFRTCYQRDRDRIIHATAFRRLNGKTQVFVTSISDYYRTRLTHTLEVAQITRSIAKILSLNENLCEAVALAHDIGHPPFGHAGERVLDELMNTYGGFEHNHQALRMVDLLENRYPHFAGLNLTAETRRGMLKKKISDETTVTMLPKQLSLEAQVMDIADEISYTTHDLDDGIESGLLTLEALEEVPLWSEAVRDVRENYPRLDEKKIRSQAVLRLINTLVHDLVTQTHTHIKQQKMDDNTVAFSLTMHQKIAQVRQFLFIHLYRHPRVMDANTKADSIVRKLFEHYGNHPENMSVSYQHRVETEGLERSVADFIAGMTDRYAEQDYHTIFEV